MDSHLQVPELAASDLPVAVIGAGPVGLAAAAHLLAQGESPVIFESGASVGTNILDWGHVRLFSPWRYVIDAAASDLLEESGWLEPDPDAYPTGEEIVTRYLEPLAAVPALRSRIRLDSRVVGVARDGFDKMKTEGRETAPFVLTVETAHGQEPFLAKAVIDASGTTATPNPLGAAGIPAIGERAVGGRVFYGIPDVLGRHRDDYASRRGAGRGQRTFGLQCPDRPRGPCRLRRRAPSITWAVRRPAGHLRNLFGGRDRRRAARSRRAWRARASGWSTPGTSVSSPASRSPG